MEKKVFARDMSERFEFRRIGYDYSCIYYNGDAHCGIWEMKRDGVVKGYEVVKGMKYKNPDGEIVYRYPSDEKFGELGWYYSGYKALEKSWEKVRTLETPVI